MKRKGYIVISNVKQWKEYQRRNILHRRIKCVARMVGIVAFICFLFTAGGLEDYTLSIKEVLIQSMIEFTAMITAFIICKVLD